MDLNLLLSTSLKEQYYQAFIEKDRWRMFLEGLGVTLEIAVFAIIIGVVLGMLLATFNYLHKKTGKLKIGALISQTYITIFRGTPVMLQMLIMFTVIFVADLGDLVVGDSVWKDGVSILVGGLTFGLNSAAYVAEIIRAGFESVDDGQMEAGRSLGMSTGRTIINVIAPQAIRNVMPPLFNEFIVLVKETAIVGSVGIVDLGRVPKLISGFTFEALPPLIISAAMYLVVVMILTGILKLIEKQLSKSDRNKTKYKFRGVFKKGGTIA